MRAARHEKAPTPESLAASGARAEAAGCEASAETTYAPSQAAPARPRITGTLSLWRRA